MFRTTSEQNHSIVFIIQAFIANRYNYTNSFLRKTKAILILLFIIAPFTSAQWIPHGPGSNTKGQVENITDREVIGAINAVATHPSDHDII